MNKVINFHNVKDSSWFDMAITILKSKYTMIGIGELESYYYEGKNLKNACHITIDDGDKTFYDVIFPILKKHNIPATIFVSPRICREGKNFWFQEIRGYNEIEIKKIIFERVKIDNHIISKHSAESILKSLDIDLIWEIILVYQQLFSIKVKKPQNMNLDQLLEIDKHGLVVIGAHTETHPILANEDDEKSQKEIVDSIEGLRNILNHEIACFAYPNGTPKLDFGEREMDILKTNNCKIAFSIESENFTIKNHPLSIPRYGLSIGSANFIKTKLFLGNYWEKMKNFIWEAESKARESISFSI